MPDVKPRIMSPTQVGHRRRLLTAADLKELSREELVRIVIRQQGSYRGLLRDKIGREDVADLVQASVLLAEGKRRGKTTSGLWSRFYDAVEKVLAAELREVPDGPSEPS